MKLRVTMKDPDGVSCAMDEAVDAQIAAIKAVDSLDGGEEEALRESKLETLSDALGRWFECDEYLTVEIDTDAGTCVVVPR